MPQMVEKRNSKGLGNGMSTIATGLICKTKARICFFVLQQLGICSGFLGVETVMTKN